MNRSSSKGAAMLFRTAESSELDALAGVHLEAFDTGAEASLVRALVKDPAFIPELSIVAVDGSSIVGHALLTRLRVEGSDSADGVLSLAPVSILSDYQGRGIGPILVTVGLQAARSRGERVVIVLGYADFYRRFGFAPARSMGIEPPEDWDVPDDAWMALELREGGLEGVRGVARYPAPFLEVV
jgi:putative acetyltransferase